MRLFYTALFYLALPFVLLRLFWRARRIPGYSSRLKERFGFCPFHLDQSIWVHAVSVGESLAAIPLIKALKKQYPAIPLVVTNMTVTGANRVKAALGDQVLQTFIPYDLPDALGRFLERINPKVAIIMETELWPNLFAACAKRKIPLVIANARLSEKSAKGYQKIASLTRDMLNTVTALASQGYADAERFIDLGLAKEKLMVTGNLKFDLEIPADLAERGMALRKELGTDRPIWIAASTHPGEDEIMLTAHRLIRAVYPNALFILVPRHPDRFDAVAALCEQQGFKIARRSKKELVTAETEIYLSDTMGEMLLMYSVSDVALVAGSFVQVGGHNMLEPAALKKPVLTGPILFNFAEISDMLIKANGIIVVHHAEEISREIQKLFADVSYRIQAAENAYQVVAANRGALKKQLELIASAIK